MKRLIAKISVATWRVLFTIGLISVAVLSLLPAGVATPAFPHSDKFAHLIAYSALGFTGAASFSRHKQRLVITLVTCGALIELLQGLTPTREMEVLDFLANTVGVLVGVFVAKIIFTESNVLNTP